MCSHINVVRKLFNCLIIIIFHSIAFIFNLCRCNNILLKRNDNIVDFCNSSMQFRNYDVKKGRSGPPLNFKLCDTKGLVIDDGIDPAEFSCILDGNMPDRYLVSKRIL